MNRVKLILIGIAVLIIASAFVTANILIKENRFLKSERDRLESNNFQLMSDNRQQSTLYLREKEVTGRLKVQRDSLAIALKIKPKQITQIIETTNTVHDTIKVPVPVNQTGLNTYLLQDSGKCFKYASKLILDGTNIKAERQLFEYNNKTIQTFYKQRPHRFIFRFGKWVYKSKIESECGETSINTIFFEK